MNTGKEFPSAFIRFHVISARQVAPAAFGFQMVHDLPHPGLLPKEKEKPPPLF
jgi:hypothetical protein